MEAAWRIRESFDNLSEGVLSSLRLYHVELMRFNQKLNLISTFTEKNADILHFYDTMKAVEFIRGDIKDSKEIYDFGSGNGFPGIVMAILFPDIQINLVEVDERKAEFLKHIIARTEIKNAKVMQMKVEDLNFKNPAKVTCRAFANLARTLLLSNKILPKGSVIYSLKGPDWVTELASLPNQICSMWNTEMAFEYELPENLGARVVLRSTRMA